MSEETFVRQSDGRLVAGPALPEQEILKPKRLLKLVVILGWAASLVISFAFGMDFAPTSPSGSLHEQVVNRLQEGCVFQFKGISTTNAGAAELEAQAKDAQKILEGQPGAKNIRWTSVDAKDGVRRMDPTATKLVVVSWEVCK